MEKTNAMRILDKNKIPYAAREYDASITDGEAVAAILNEPPEEVFKTLVTVSDKGEHLVFAVPVCAVLDLKKAARAAGVKSVSMIRQKELEPLTGYVHGGCSPVGMKKRFRTFVHETARTLPQRYVSAGKVGRQMRLSPADLLTAVGAVFADLTAE